MASVGPELPPHLMKRKRSLSNDDDGDSSAPPTKIQAASPPPKERRILGPALPPAPLDERPHEPAGATAFERDDDSSSDDSDDDSSSDDSDDYGPSLPPPPGTISTSHYKRGEEDLTTTASSSTSDTQPPKPQRSEWMLVPPTSDDWTSRIDPTKLKARKFAGGKGAKAPAEKSGISAIWTETPEEKLKRLEDEVMGRTVPSASGGAAQGRGKKEDKEAEETARRIREYNEKMRGESMYEANMKKGKGGDGEESGEKEEEDDPSARAFDKEKDMNPGGRLGHAQKREMVKRASDFGSRFERGSYL